MSALDRKLDESIANQLERYEQTEGMGAVLWLLAVLGGVVLGGIWGILAVVIWGTW